MFSNTLKVFAWEKGNQFSLMAAGGRGSPVGVQQHIPGLEKNPAWTDVRALGRSWCCPHAQGCFSVSLPVPHRCCEQRSRLSLVPVHNAFWHRILRFLVFNFACFPCVCIQAVFRWQIFLYHFGIFVQGKHGVSTQTEVTSIVLSHAACRRV